MLKEDVVSSDTDYLVSKTKQMNSYGTGPHGKNMCKVQQKYSRGSRINGEYGAKKSFQILFSYCPILTLTSFIWCHAFILFKCIYSNLIIPQQVEITAAFLLVP